MAGLPAPDFSGYIEDRAGGFVGRRWVFSAIEDWLGRPEGPRVLLLTGSPGSGKTAVCARLCLAAVGTAGPRGEKVASAFHFCRARDRYWTDPFVFAGSLATQLANKYPAFLEHLPVDHDQGNINIQVRQDVRSVKGGQVVGVVVQVSGPSPDSTFMHAVRGPLEAMFAQGRQKPVVLIVDALDEALQYGGPTSIVQLLADMEHLPCGVRMILSTRPDDRVLNRFHDAQVIALSSGEHRSDNDRDIKEFVEEQLRQDAALMAARDGLPPSVRQQWVSEVVHRAGGNFQYVSLLTRSISSGARVMADFAGLPEGLDELYHDTVSRVVDLGGKRWDSDYAPLLGLLSVAQEPMTPRQLGRFTGASASSAWSSLRDLGQFLENVADDSHGEEPRYRLFHQSLADFLERPQLVQPGHTLYNRFHLPSQEWHEHLVRFYGMGVADWGSADWERMDDYGLFHVVDHLHALRSEDSHRAALYEVINQRYRSALHHRLHSDDKFLQDVELAIAAAEGELMVGAPRVLAYSVGQACVREQGSAVPLPLLVLLFRAGRREEALARLRSLSYGGGTRRRDSPRGDGPQGEGGTPDEVEGLIEFAKVCRLEHDVATARELIERALSTSIEVFEEDDRLQAIRAAVRGCSVVDEDATWVVAALQPVVDAVRALTHDAMRVDGLIECATALGSAGPRQAAELAEEAEELSRRIGRRRGGSAIEVARLWNRLGRADRQRSLILEALEWPGKDDRGEVQDTSVTFSLLLLAGRTQDASRLLDRLGDPATLFFFEDYLDSREALERTWDILRREPAGYGRSVAESAVLRRMAETGSARQALALLPDLEAELPDQEAGLADRLAVRLAVAEECRATDPEQARGLVSEALELHERWSEQARVDAAEGLATSIQFTEKVLLRLAAVAASLHDPSWSSAALDDVLAIMLGQVPVSALLGLTADVWEVQAKSAVAAGFAEIGNEERASALVTEALTDADRISSTRARREGLAAAAETLTPFHDRPWAQAAARRLLDLRVVRPGQAEIAAWSALAREANQLPEEVPLTQDVAARLIVIMREIRSAWDLPHYRRDLRLREDLDFHAWYAVDGALDLLPALSSDETAEVIEESWALVARTEDPVGRRAMIERLVSVSAPEEPGGPLVDRMRRPWDRVVMLAASAALHADQRTAEQAANELTEALDQARQLSWADDLESALAAVVEAVPADAEIAGGWLVEVLMQVRGHDWPAWLSERILGSAFDLLDTAHGDEAHESVRAAMETARGIRDKSAAAHFWCLAAECLDMIGDQAAAEEACARALRAVTAADPDSRGTAVAALVRALAGSAIETRMVALADDPEYVTIRTELIDELARTREAKPPAMEQLRNTLVEDDRTSDFEAWAGEVARLTEEILDSAPPGDRLHLVEEIGEHLSSCLGEQQLREVLAAIAGRLMRPGAAATADQDVGVGGILPLAVPFVRMCRNLILDLEEDQQPQASLHALGRITADWADDGYGTVEARIPGWLEQMAEEISVLGEVAEKALDGKYYECCTDAVLSILAREESVFTVGDLGLRAELEPHPELFRALRTAALVLGRVIPKLIPIGELDAAEAWTSGVVHNPGRAYVQAVLEHVLRAHRLTDTADRTLDAAVLNLEEAGPAAWAVASAEVAAALVVQTRLAEAFRLADEQQEPEDRNHVLDAIAEAQLAAGDPDEALSTLALLQAVYAPIVTSTTDVVSHTAAMHATEALARRGEFERAAEVIVHLSDPWAFPERDRALHTFGECLAELVGHTDAVSVADALFGALRQARYVDREQILAWVTAAAPVIRAAGAGALVETWQRLRETEEWAYAGSLPKPGVVHPVRTHVS